MREWQLSTKALIRIAMLSVVLLMGLLLAVYLITFSGTVLRQKRASFDALTQNVEAKLNLSFDNIDFVAKRCAFGHEIQTIMFFKNPEEYFPASKAAGDFFTYVVDASQDIAGIHVISEGGRSFTSDNTKRLRVKGALREIVGEGDFGTLTPAYHVVHEENMSPEVYYLYPFFNIRDGEYNPNQTAVCVVQADVEYLLNGLIMDDLEGSAIAAIYEDTIVASSHPLTEGESALFHEASAGAHRLAFGGREYWHSLIDLPQLGWRLIYIVPERELLSGMDEMRRIGILLLLASIVLLGVIMTRLVSMLARPIRDLTRDMQAVRAGMATRVRPVALSDMRPLSAGINEMLDAIEVMHQGEQSAQRKLYQAAYEQNHALLHAYRSQINPHFLFNTLECIRSMARHHGVKALEGTIRSLSDMFRYSLRSDMMVTLDEEIAHAENYIAIMNQRSSCGYDFRVRVEDGARTARMPAMCLQPIIENCVFHAFEGVEGRYIIHVHAEIIVKDGENRLRLRVTDNGRGLAADALEALRVSLEGPSSLDQKQSVALPNIAKRLNLIYGTAEPWLRVASREGHYTQVVLVFPQNARISEFDGMLPETPAYTA